MTNQAEKLQNNQSSGEPLQPGVSPEQILTSIGASVQAARKNKCLSIREVSFRTNISEATISNFEKGKLKNITLNNLISICSTVGIRSITF